MRLDHESYYASYARLLLSFGLAFRPGQKLLVEIPAEAAALAESLNRFLGHGRPGGADRGGGQTRRRFLCGDDAH